MPHSSGGGHSSGGSHGSSRSKPADMRYGNKYYRGANRYVYYRGGVPQYYYSDRPYTLETSRSERIRAIFSSIISVFIGCIMAFYGFISFPHKVKTDYNTDILIRDAAQLLSETEKGEMEEAFHNFQKKTGVTPAFFTVKDQEMVNQSSGLKQYAYNEYVNTFDDEKHWLVVYCAGDDAGSWAWEGMIGDDCDGMISTDLENEFTERLHKNLTNSPEKIAASVINAFEETGKKAGQFSFNNLFTLAFALGGGGLFVFTAVRKIISTGKTKAEDDPRIESVQCPDAEKEPETAKCAYCNGEFVLGLHTNCPHCGAPIEKWE